METIREIPCASSSGDGSCSQVISWLLNDGFWPRSCRQSRGSSREELGTLIRYCSDILGSAPADTDSSYRLRKYLLAYAGVVDRSVRLILACRLSA